MSRVAVVGAGVAGLVAAYELDKAGHDIHLFEAAGHAGGHANTVAVETEAGTHDVDTGFVVLNDRNYPNLKRLFAELGVATQPSDMSFSVSDADGRFEWASRPLGVFACPAHVVDPRFHRMLSDLVRFNREARGLIALNGEGPSLRAFLADGGYSDYFVERLIVPQVAAIWSADPAELWSFPVSFLAAFLENHGALQLLGRPRWRSVTGGSRRYVEAILAALPGRVHLRAPVRRIARDREGVELRFEDTVARFDEVVLALHSDQALALLAEPTAAERDVLGAIPYKANDVVLHTDERLLPRRRAAWAAWNYERSGRREAGETGTVCVHVLANRLQALPFDAPVIVTLNPLFEPAGKLVQGEFHYAHPLFDRRAIAALARLGALQGRRDTWYCGAWTGRGSHEDGLVSGLDLTDRFCRDGRCHVVIGGLIAYFDHGHLTTTFARTLVPDIATALTEGLAARAS